MDDCILMDKLIRTTYFRLGKRCLLALVFLIFGVLDAEAQRVDRSGLYFIASYGLPSSSNPIYNASNPQKNFYLRPAADPHQPNNIDAYWFPIGQEELNHRDKPFLTTNKTNRVVNTAAWLIQYTGESDGEGNYLYYIIHVGTGKYVKYEKCYSGGLDGNARRKAMHLQASDDPSAETDEGAYKFVIEESTYSGTVYYAIRPQSLISGNRYWNISGGNKAFNYGQSDGDGLWYGGLIGLYDTKGNTSSGTNSNWIFESLSDFLPSDLLPPLITYNNATNKVKITSFNDGTTIYYTTDGTTPTVSEDLKYTAPFSRTTPCTVKAIAKWSNDEISEVVSFDLNQVATPVLSFNNNAIEITCATPDVYFYYTTDGSEPAIGATGTMRYIRPLQEGVSNQTIKVIATKYNMINSASVTDLYKLKCDDPVITYSNMTFTLSRGAFPSSATVYYTTDGTEPTTSSPSTTSPVTFNNPTLPFTLKAMAVAGNDYYDSDVVTVTMSGSEPLQGNGTEANPYLIDNADDYMRFVDMANTAEGAEKCYRIVNNINVSAVCQISQPFSGILEAAADDEGNFYTISGLRHPIFDLIDAGVTDGTVTTSGIVRNIILKDVDIVNHAGNTGAIACEIKGGALIYNCGILSGSVGGTGDTGGLVGWLHAVPYIGYNNEYSYPNGIYGFTRVVNCFSFADITNAGTYAAGIVGNNDTGSNTQNHPEMNSNLRSAVVNCMFYGDIFGGTNKYPVYGNKDLINTNNGINNYDYCLESATFHNDFQNADRYHHSWPAKEEYLTRFEYYRNILNCNRDLFAFYVSGKPYSDATNVTARDKMAKWVLDPSIAKYPILKQWKKYPSMINPDMEKIWDNQTDPSNPHWVYRTATSGEEGNIPYQGKKLGELSVTVKSGKHPRLSTYGLNSTQYADQDKTLCIFDMDTLNHDYGYCKVQLPYYNEVFGNSNGANHYEKYCANYTDSIVTGWKITSVTGGTPGTFVEDWESGYNFADRNCTNKDLYSVSGRVFAQGGYYYVPEGVTAITIEAYWGRAVYVHNAEGSVDRVDLGESAFPPAGTYDGYFHGQPVYTSIKSAIEVLNPEGSGASALTVYDQAIVLVGNVQHLNSDLQATLGWDEAGYSNQDNYWHLYNKPYTLTSVDLDFDNEPDYCFQLQLGKGTTRVNIHPVRFDFLAMPSLGMAIRTDEFLYAIGIFIPRGHFEVTETAFMHTGQFEYDTHYDFRKKEAPLILNGGEYEQFVSAQKWYSNTNRTKYIIVGGHVWMKEFTPGKHISANCSTRHCAVSVMGGEYGRLCLSGVFLNNSQVNNRQDNPHCYTNGGKFGTMSGAGMEDIKGDVTFEIDHSLIKEFYGGGLNAARPITGSINVTIKNSIVGKYCGGPFTGNMNPNTQVTTHASNTIFGYFYGGGNGGTNFNRDNMFNCDWTVRKVDITEANWRSTDEQGSYGVPRHKGSFDAFSPLSYVSDDYGYQAQFEFELIDMSSGLPPATNNPVCAVMRTYVHEAQFTATEVQKVESTLTDCTVLHDFYGGGNLGKVIGNVTSTLDGTTVWGSAYGGGNDSDAPTFSIHNGPFVLDSLLFPYRDGGSVNHPGHVGFQKDGGVVRKYKWINVDDPLATGHTPTNDPTFQHNGEWYCVTKEDMSDLGAVHGSTFLNINGNTKIYGSRQGEDELGNPVTLYDGAAFGGGNKSTVFGNSTVTIDGTEGLLVSNVFGGGNVAITGGDSKVEIYNGTIGILDEDTGMPYANYENSFISGRAFAAGKGAYDPDKENDGKWLGLVKGNATLYMYGGQVLSCLYGGGEISNVGEIDTVMIVRPVNGVNRQFPVEVPESGGVSTVTMTGGVVGFERDSTAIIASHEIGNVFGGGKGNPATDFNTWTNVNKAIVNINGGRVWGSVFGGGEEGHVLGDVELAIGGSGTQIGTIGETSYDGNVFGGGRGHEARALTAACVSGNVTINVSDGHIYGSVFGGGRNGSVGTYLVPDSVVVADEKIPHPLYGEMKPDVPDDPATPEDETETYGHVTVNVSGGMFGHPAYSDHDRVGGNVYGGGKGVVEDPNDNPIAPMFARVKETHVDISGTAFVEGSVFGSGEDGHVMGDTYVMVRGGQIGGEEYNPTSPTLCGDVFHGNVYGGGRGLDTYIDTIINPGTSEADTILGYSSTAGKVYGNTNVTITGGRICRNVYGGGNLASVGIADEPTTGRAKIIITGGTIGVEPNSANRNGIVFGAGKGRAGSKFQHLSFVKNTDVIITKDAKVLCTVYGSGEDGHVRERTNIVIGNVMKVDSNWDGVLEDYTGNNVVIGTHGVSGVEGNIYGAGRGVDRDESGHLSETAGEVGVSTRVEINNGWVKGSVYGGGRMASVGIVEAVAEELCSPNDPEYSIDFGHATIIIGSADDTEEHHAIIGTEDGDNGYVFGGCKGDAGVEFAGLAYLHETNVTIKGHAQVYGSVFGGGEDGHVTQLIWPDTINYSTGIPEDTLRKPGNTHVFIEGNCNIGPNGAFGRRGNVYAGGRGIDQYVDPNTGIPQYSPTAGKVEGNTHVTVMGNAVVHQNVYGGGNKSIVKGRKTVNIAENCQVLKNIYGGSNEIPFNPNPEYSHSGLKTVNMSGGMAHKLFGCSHNTIDGDLNLYYVDGNNRYLAYQDGSGDWHYKDNNNVVHDVTLSDLQYNDDPTSFVNISGGHLYDLGGDDNPERGSIHGAGLAGLVYGSVIINIGSNAIANNPYKAFNVDSLDLVRELTFHEYAVIPPHAHKPSKLQVSGSVFGGADYYQSENNPGDWTLFNVKGYSNIYIDGKGYNMDALAANATFPTLPANCMVIDGNIYGSGTHCESGDRGRNIIVRNYGNRVNDSGHPEWFHHSTRPMGTIQRCDNLVIDHSNFTFSGRPRLGQDDGNLYAIMKIDSCLYIADSSALTLGDGSAPAHMDSIRKVQSAYLMGQTANNNVLSKKAVTKLKWGWIGLKPTTDNADQMCFMKANGTDSTALAKVQENIILFNGPSKLWVRYNEGTTQKYGELKGFFRMLSPYKPHGIESFAFSRPKIMRDTVLVNPPHAGELYNVADGGFLSYNIEYNYFLGKGYQDFVNRTNTKQYPYTNVLGVQLSKTEPNIEDVLDYRMWVFVGPYDGRCWYVDGRGIGSGGWGKDIVGDGWGLYPDKPKLTVNGVGGVYDGTFPKGDNGTNPATKINFNYQGTYTGDPETEEESDIVFVVGPIMDVNRLIGDVTYGINLQPDYELRLYRYPGGHKMSNDSIDLGGGSAPSGSSYNGLGTGVKAGPGPNYISMLDVGTNHSLELNNVSMDGLYGYSVEESEYLLFREHNIFQQNSVTKPMIETHNGATLTLKGNMSYTVGGENTMGGLVKTKGTIVTRGYNNIDASASNNYYVNSNQTSTVNGGGLYVHSSATAMNVEGLVTIFDNKQKNGSVAISSNVFLPTFDKHLNITNALSEATRIGITSPVKNAQTGANAYLFNTFSPVAVGVRTGTTGDVANATIDAQNAWLNNNFHDDLLWFFGCGYNVENGSHTAYYKSTIPDYPTTIGFVPAKTLFFGWTWNNVVRTQPSGYAVVSGQKEVEITSQEGLAWLISKVNGLNGQVKSNMADTTVMVKAEIEGLDQYIWVPAGSEKATTANFAGTFDGRGHLIKGLTIRYIGIGDSRYEFNNYGMFGKTNGATLNRTFLVNEYIEPNSKGNMGGLIGMMQGTGSVVSNSEAVVEIKCEPTQQTDANACGGLVGFLIDGEIHSSMSMPDITAERGYVGGLVGSSSDPESNQHSGVKLCNSFANAQFNVGTNAVTGGLLGNNILSAVGNCYANLTNAGTGTVASLVHTNMGAISQCYGKEGYSININNYGDHITDSYTYTPTFGANNLGYMYSDNVVTIGTNKTPLFEKLNDWVPNTTYAKWARPGLAEINEDLPVQMLCNYSASNEEGFGDFSSMATITGVSKALQFGGVVRDGNELNGALAADRLSASDALFVYGDITVSPTATPITAAKISIYEHASIRAVGTLSSHNKIYVGISFDNSSGHAWATPNVNYGLAGAGGDLLPRDWHMFSTPLSNAPLGFDYGSTNVYCKVNSDYSHEHFYNNPWVSLETEFSWITGNGGENHTGDHRYWMKTFDPTTQTTDGYFPTSVDESVITRDDNLFIVGSDECPEPGRYRYPYGMDFYTWTEPDYHWINFKRNGPNHWHSDENESRYHDHLDYVTEVATNHSSAEANVNEAVLISGKGYLASITVPTFMQSHGNLNSGTQTINLTAKGKYVTGWNLVGNPFHGYIDFDLFSSNTNNEEVLSKNSSSQPFYVVYDADEYQGCHGSGFLYQPKTGSEGAAYAGRYIHPHQGFYVKLAEKEGSKEDPPHLEFTESMLVTRKDVGSESYFHKSAPNYPLVNLYLSSENGCRDVTVIEFHRPEWGGAIKLKELRVGNGIFYGHHGDDNYAALFVKEGAKKVPLWFEAKETDIYTIAWKTANGDFPSMYLVDNLTGVKYDMVENHSYTFQGHRNDYWSRFYITFSLDEEEPESDDNFSVFFDGSQWVVTGDGDLEVIDVLGHVLKRVRVSGGQNRISLPNVAAGVYLMRLTNRKQSKVLKVIVTK